MTDVGAHQSKKNSVSRHVVVGIETKGLYPQRGDGIAEIGPKGKIRFKRSKHMTKQHSSLFGIKEIP
jgi:hypothetical protein